MRIKRVVGWSWIAWASAFNIAYDLGFFQDRGAHSHVAFGVLPILGALLLISDQIDRLKAPAGENSDEQ